MDYFREYKIIHIDTNLRFNKAIINLNFDIKGYQLETCDGIDEYFKGGDVCEIKICNTIHISVDRFSIFIKHEDISIDIPSKKYNLDVLNEFLINLREIIYQYSKDNPL